MIQFILGFFACGLLSALILGILAAREAMASRRRYTCPDCGRHAFPYAEMRDEYRGQRIIWWLNGCQCRVGRRWVIDGMKPASGN